MGRQVITLDDLAARGRRWRTLRDLAARRWPMTTNQLMRATAAEADWGDAERQRVRSALRDLHLADWVARDDLGWTVTPAGREALAAVEARKAAA